MILVYQKNLVVIKNLFKVECSHDNKKYEIIISFYGEEQTITLCFNNYDEQYNVFDLIKNAIKNKDDILDLDEILNK